MSIGSDSDERCTDTRQYQAVVQRENKVEHDLYWISGSPYAWRVQRAPARLTPETRGRAGHAILGRKI
jgi:hypothetical protein